MIIDDNRPIPFADVKQRGDGSLVRIADCEPELDTCTWTYKEYAWESACGAEFVFTEEQDSLELNSFKFCHKCGCKIVEAK